MRISSRKWGLETYSKSQCPDGKRWFSVFTLPIGEKKSGRVLLKYKNIFLMVNYSRFKY